MDLTKLRGRCKSRFRDTGNAIYSDAEWDDYLREAQQDVYSASPWWPFMEARTESISVDATTTEAGVILPGNVIRVDSVYDVTNEYSYSPLYGRTAHRYYFPQPLQQRGLPTNYRLRSGALEVYPLPSGTFQLSVDYHVTPQVMLSGTSVPPWPEAHHPILIPGALYRAYEDDGNYQAAEQFRVRFEQGLDRLKDDLLAPRLEGYTLIPFDDTDDVW